MSRGAEIRARLEEVLDPEIDRSVVAMGFVQNVEEAEGAVRVSFRLPTHWCAASFAYIMAVDMRTAVEVLPWVTQVEIILLDHFASGRINQAMAQRSEFADVFPGEASGDLELVRRRFLEKAFLSRQEALLTSLTPAPGIAAALEMRVLDLARLAVADGPLGAEARRYLSVRRQIGGEAAAEQPAFTDLSGTPVTAALFSQHMRDSRRARNAADANAEHCQMLILARQVAPTPDDRTSPKGLYE